MEIPAKVRQRIETISDDELAFRGWTREGMRERFLSRLEADRRSPQVGELAPEFSLERLSASGRRTGEQMTLSSLRGQPVGLIFGSFT
jgi:hypothetical protein